MKLAILCCSDAWGGLEKNILNFTSWLKERDNEVWLIVTPQSPLAINAEAAGLDTVKFQPSQRKHLNFTAAFALKKILQNSNLNHLIIGHYNQLYIASISKVLSFNRPIKLLYLQQMQHNIVKKDPYHAFFYRQIDIWLTPLQYLKSQLLRNTTLDESKVRILPLSCDVRQFTEEIISKIESRKLLNLPVDKFIVGIIGRIDKEKGHDCLLKATKILLEKGIDLNIAIVGNETVGAKGYKDYLMRMCDDLQISSNVSFISYRDDVSKIFKALDVFCLCSVSEPFGMVTVEAMLSGIPVIGTDSGGTSEILEFGKLGILFPPKDEIALANAIERLYNNPQMAQRLSEKALQSARQMYSHSHWCEEIEKLVNEI